VYVVFEMSKPHVAVVAEDATNLACGVVVVYSPSTKTTKRLVRTTDGTVSIVVPKNLLCLVGVDACLPPCVSSGQVPVLACGV
jgi:hypothetical protein